MSTDAMGCQTALAAQIVEAGGGSVLADKDKQPQLAEAVRAVLNRLNAPGYPARETSVREMLDKGLGRIGTRCCTAAANPDWLDTLGLCGRWRKLTCVARIEATHQIGSKTAMDKRDVTFSENASRIRLRNAALNFPFLWRGALHPLRNDKPRAISLPINPKAAARDRQYLAEVVRLGLGLGGI